MSKPKRLREQKKDTSLHVEQRDKVKEQFTIKEFPWTEKQKTIIDTILDKKSRVILIQGCAGTSKTTVGLYCLLKLLNDKKISEIKFIRSAIESSSKSIGFLPGLEQKWEAYAGPLHDKMSELLHESDANKLTKDNRVTIELVNFLRGRQSNVQGWLIDEFQNFSLAECITTLTRLGKFSKIIAVGDFGQTDINGKSGFKKVFNLFNDEESRKNGIFCFEFGKEDIMRSEELKFIIERFEKLNENPNDYLPSQGKN